MARVTKLGRLLTRISGLLGPVKDITRVSVITNSSQSNEVPIQKRIYPYFHLVTGASWEQAGVSWEAQESWEQAGSEVE